MDCPACGHPNREGARFCGACATSLADAAVCSNCGTRNPIGQKFCDACAQPLGVLPAPMPTPPPSPAYSTSFVNGRYQVKRFLGEGGKKRVYLFSDNRLNRDVAYAEIKTDGLDAEGLVRIAREAQAMGNLGDHPHIVTVHDIGEEDGPSTGSGGPHPYLVSQLMAGGDVEGLIKQAEQHRLSLDQVFRIADQVCQALEYAHAHGIVHRDLKPGNVWLTADPSTGPSTGSGQRSGRAVPSWATSVWR